MISRGNFLFSALVLSSFGFICFCPENTLCQAIQEGDTLGALSCLENAPELAIEADENGNYPIHFASALGNRIVAEKLIKLHENFAINSKAFGAAISFLRNRQGSTPLHLAGDCNMAYFLVERGAHKSLSLHDSSYQTPMDIAMSGSAPGMAFVLAEACKKYE